MASVSAKREASDYMEGVEVPFVRRQKHDSETTTPGNDDWVRVPSPKSPTYNPSDDEDVGKVPHAGPVDTATGAPAGATAEAPLGAGFKCVRDGNAIEVGLKIACPREIKHKVKGYKGLDTSASMNRNGGKEGLKDVIEHLPSMAQNLPPGSAPVEMGAFLFDVFPTFGVEATNDDPETPFKEVTSGPQIATYPIQDWDKPMGVGNFSMSRHLMNILHSHGDSTDLEKAVKFGIDKVVECLLRIPSVAEREQTVGLLLLCTDGMANKGERDPDLVRRIVDERIKQTGLCLIVAVLALGTGTDAHWLKTLCGKTGVAGFAPDPRHSEEAFQKAYGCVTNAKGIFMCKWNIVRTNATTGESDNIAKGIEHFGLITSKNLLAKFSVPAPPGGFQAGDRVEVLFNGDQYVYDFAAAKGEPQDVAILDEAGVLQELQDAQAELVQDAQSQNMTPQQAIASAEALMHRFARRTVSSEVRHVAEAFSDAVSSACTQVSAPGASPTSPSSPSSPSHWSYGAMPCKQASTPHAFMEAASQSAWDHS